MKRHATAIVAVVVLSAASASMAATYSWNAAAGGNWSTGWSANPAYPNSTVDIATIANDLAANQEIVIDVTDARLASLTIGDGGSAPHNSWTISSSDAATRKLSFGDGAISADSYLTLGAGAHVISAPVVSAGFWNRKMILNIPTGSSVKFTGGVSGTGSALGFNAASGGTVIFDSALTTTRDITTAAAVTLRFTNAAYLPAAPSASNINLSAGAGLQNDGAMTITNGFGGGKGQINYGYNLKLSAYNGDFTINHGGAGAAVAYSQGGILTFGSADATHTVRYVNPLQLSGSANATLSIASQHATGAVAAAELQGGITQGANLNNLLVLGNAGLILSGASTYTGTTRLAGDYTGSTPQMVVRVNHADALAGGLLIFGDTVNNSANRGGILEGSASFTSFTRQLGAGAGQVRWHKRIDNYGGFSAFGSDFTVALGVTAPGSTTSPETITWAGDGGPNYFAANEQNLVFGSPLADRTVRFLNPVEIALPAGSTWADQVRTIRVHRGVGTAPEVEISGNITQAAGAFTGRLVKVGAGTLVLSGTNSYAGTTTVSEGTLLFEGTHAGAGKFIVAGGATLGGTGAIGSTVEVTGTLSPGASVGQLTAGAVDFKASSRMVVEIDSTLPAWADSVVATGDATGLANASLELVGIPAVPSKNFKPSQVATPQTILASANDLGTAGEAFGAILGVPATPGWSVGVDYASGNAVLSIAWTGVLGDANLDGHVNISDLTVLANNYGKVGDYTWLHGDFNYDGILNVSDLTLMANNYGKFSDDVVPEPLTLGLLAAGGLALLRRRRA